MKINYFLTGMASASALLMLPGCIDDNYDLSDIDTTTELKVNDLVVPLNLKSISMQIRALSKRWWHPHLPALILSARLYPALLIRGRLPQLH